MLKGQTMLTHAVVFALTALSPNPEAATVSPSCEVRLQDVHDARRSLDGLHRSERTLRRRIAGAQTRAARLGIERVLLPIANQARALEDELDKRERAYIRCVEAQLDARAQRATGTSEVRHVGRNCGSDRAHLSPCPPGGTRPRCWTPSFLR